MKRPRKPTKAELRSMHDPLTFFLNCIPEFKNKPQIQEILKKKPFMGQVIMIPKGQGQKRNKGPLRKILEERCCENFNFKKWLFEKGMIEYLKLLTIEIGHIPSAKEITADCRQNQTIDLVHFLYDCQLFGGHIKNLIRDLEYELRNNKNIRIQTEKEKNSKRRKQ